MLWPKSSTTWSSGLHVVTPLLLATCLTASAATDESNKIPLVDTFRKAEARELKPHATKNGWRTYFEGHLVELLSDTTDPVSGHAVVVFHDKAPKASHRFVLPYNICDPYLLRIASLDADGNGISDLFIVSEPVGVSGIGSNAPLIAAFFRYPGAEIRFRRMSTFFGDVDMFRFVRDQPAPDFITIEYVPDESNGSYVAHVFSMTESGYADLSRSTPGFPMFFQDTESGYSLIEAPSKEALRHAVLSSPDVWAHGRSN